MLEVRIAAVVGEPTGHKLVEKLVALGVDATGSTGSSSRSATARVYWGLNGGDCRQPALNKNASSYTKFNELERFEEEDIPHPKFWRTPPISGDHYPILGRSLHHAEGRGINVYNRQRDVDGAYNDYYTQMIPSTSEWRYWVFRDSILGCYERTRNWPVERQGFGRNWWNGYGYTLTDSPSEDAGDYAKRAIRAMRLDFGAVDLLQGENGRYYVLEVNTAPGATSYCQRALSNLAEKIKVWYRNV